VGNSLDGIIAKRTDLPYRSGERGWNAENKGSEDRILRYWRIHVPRKVRGSILYFWAYTTIKLSSTIVGFVAVGKSFATPELQAKPEKLIGPTGKAPGEPSRWSTQRSSEWLPIKTKLVAEVQYDHFSGGRFRHGTKFYSGDRIRPRSLARYAKLRKKAEYR
jgi:ATP-dependent DNA ligase